MSLAKSVISSEALTEGEDNKDAEVTLGETLLSVSEFALERAT